MLVKLLSCLGIGSARFIINPPINTPMRPVHFSLVLYFILFSSPPLLAQSSEATQGNSDTTTATDTDTDTDITSTPSTSVTATKSKSENPNDSSDSDTSQSAPNTAADEGVYVEDDALEPSDPLSTPSNNSQDVSEAQQNSIAPSIDTVDSPDDDTANNEATSSASSGATENNQITDTKKVTDAADGNTTQQLTAEEQTAQASSSVNSDASERPSESSSSAAPLRGDGGDASAEANINSEVLSESTDRSLSGDTSEDQTNTTQSDTALASEENSLTQQESPDINEAADDLADTAEAGVVTTQQNDLDTDSAVDSKNDSEEITSDLSSEALSATGAESELTSSEDLVPEADLSGVLEREAINEVGVEERLDTVTDPSDLDLVEQELPSTLVDNPRDLDIEEPLLPEELEGDAGSENSLSESLIGQKTLLLFEGRGQAIYRNFKTKEHPLSHEYSNIKSYTSFQIPYASLSVMHSLNNDLSVNASLATSVATDNELEGEVLVDDLYLLQQNRRLDMDFVVGRFSPTTGGILSTKGPLHLFHHVKSHFNTMSSVEGVQTRWWGAYGYLTLTATRGQSHLYDTPHLSSFFSYPLFGALYHLNLGGLVFQASYHLRNTKKAQPLQESYETETPTSSSVSLPVAYDKQTTSYLSYGIGFFRGPIEASVDFNHYAVTPTDLDFEYQDFGYKENMIVIDTSYLAFPWKPFLHVGVNRMNEQKYKGQVERRTGVWSLGSYYYISENVAYYSTYSLNIGETVPSKIDDDGRNIIHPPHPHRSHTLYLGVKVSGLGG